MTNENEIIGVAGRFPHYDSWHDVQGTVIYRDFTDKQGNQVAVFIGHGRVQTMKESSGEGYMNTDRFDWVHWLQGGNPQGEVIMRCGFTEFGAKVDVLDRAIELFDPYTIEQIKKDFTTLENQF